MAPPVGGGRGAGPSQFKADSGPRGFLGSGGEPAGTGPVARRMRCLVVSLILVGLCEAALLPKETGCGEPDLPLHSAYLCQPPLCQGLLEPGLFKDGAMLEYYCQPGYVLASLPGLAICRGGEWHVVQGAFCKPRGTSAVPHGSSLTLVDSIPLMAGTLVLLSAVVLALTLCFLVVKSVPSPWTCSSRPYETLEDPDFMVEGVGEPGTNRMEDTPVPLPSYEEAVYGHTGGPVPPASCGPMPLALSAQPEGSGSSCVPGGSLVVDDPPPSYQEAMAAASALAQDAPARQLAEGRAMLSAFPQGR